MQSLNHLYILALLILETVFQLCVGRPSSHRDRAWTVPHGVGPDAERVFSSLIGWEFRAPLSQVNQRPLLNMSSLNYVQLSQQ